MDISQKPLCLEEGTIFGVDKFHVYFSVCEHKHSHTVRKRHAWHNYNYICIYIWSLGMFSDEEERK